MYDTKWFLTGLGWLLGKEKYHHISLDDDRNTELVGRDYAKKAHDTYLYTTRGQKKDITHIYT